MSVQLVAWTLACLHRPSASHLHWPLPSHRCGSSVCSCLPSAVWRAKLLRVRRHRVDERAAVAVHAADEWAAVVLVRRGSSDLAARRGVSNVATNASTNAAANAAAQLAADPVHLASWLCDRCQRMPLATVQREREKVLGRCAWVRAMGGQRCSVMSIASLLHLADSPPTPRSSPPFTGTCSRPSPQN